MSGKCHLSRPESIPLSNRRHWAKRTRRTWGYVAGRKFYVGQLTVSPLEHELTANGAEVRGAFA